jgi:hypothetical protein
MKTQLPDERTLKKGLEALRAVLRRMRWNDQGGYPDWYKGKWNIISTGLPQTYPKELNALFAMAGIVPDEIQPLGYCDTCKFSINGRERGYIRPCLICMRPKMSEFKPKPKARKP